MAVKASIPFVQRSDELSESYTTGSSAAFKTEIKSLMVEDIRGSESSLTFEKCGIEVLKFKTSLTREDFNDKIKVEQQYCSEIAAAILERLGADSIQVFDAQVRRRDQGFPVSAINTTNMQPALRPHIDTTYDEARVKIPILHPDAEQLLKGKWIHVNAWKPLRGPLRDWPLTLCRPDSMESSDIFTNRIITNGQNNENMQLHHNPHHKWIYLSDQMDDEVWLFRQANSDAEMGVPHCSFPLPSVGAPGRESIEIRAFVYF